MVRHGFFEHVKLVEHYRYDAWSETLFRTPSLKIGEHTYRADWVLFGVPVICAKDWVVLHVSFFILHH